MRITPLQAMVCPLLLIGLVAFGQELNVQEAKRVPVPRPTNVRVDKKDARLEISWDVTRIQKVTTFEVFKKVGDESILVRTVERPSCRDPKSECRADLSVTDVPHKPTEYFVVAVDYRDNRSRPSEPVAYVPPQEKR
jgi:hypothetical protein